MKYTASIKKEVILYRSEPLFLQSLQLFNFILVKTNLCVLNNFNLLNRIG